MKYRVTRLDRRHNGHLRFKYAITPEIFERGQAAELLIELRNWAWATFGPSSELEYARQENAWAWDTEHGHKRIYLKSDVELTFFNLKFQ